MVGRHIWDVEAASSSLATPTRIGEQKRCTCKKLRIFGVFSHFRDKIMKGCSIDAFGLFCPIYELELMYPTF